MDATELYQLMENPSLLTKDTLTKLKQLTEDYPYFHTAKILYLKNLAVLNAVNFTSELKRMAIYISDRKKLFTLIEGTQYGLKTQIKKKEPEKQDDSFSLINSFLSSHSQLEGVTSSDPSILFRPSASSDYLYWTTSKEPEENTDDNNSPKLQHHELIDSFLKEDQQRPPGKGLQLDNDDSLNYMEEEEKKKDGSYPKDEDSYFTETLARIYIKQKRYEKALQIIKNLSLKYPEKNVYFADQIRFLEKLIINTKK
ncbi:MAG: hypothetical protein LBL58_09670 [Tannerellaceae bacterium]|jgi:hypothetical protein|nr:hypothetical protein [Tannerellaceae bacterium]